MAKRKGSIKFPDLRLPDGNPTLVVRAVPWDRVAPAWTQLGYSAIPMVVETSVLKAREFLQAEAAKRAAEEAKNITRNGTFTLAYCKKCPGWKAGCEDPRRAFSKFDPHPPVL